MSKYYTMRYDSVFKNALYRDEEILRLWLKVIELNAINEGKITS